METILANLGKPRRVKHRGRDYLVTSASLIMHGVLSGSQGALYYPLDEIKSNPLAWNGVPIVVDHPIRNGSHVSARDPDVLEESGIGHVFRANADGNERLASEAWFDVDATRNYDQRKGTSILKDLEAGKVVELSTGLFTDNHPAPSGSIFNGKPYTHIARNYRPDHLALLPRQKGACSASDGCGFNINTELGNDVHIESVDSLMSEINGLIGVNVEGQVRSKVTGWFKRYGAGTGKGDTHESAQRGNVVLTDKQRELGADAKSQADAGQNPPSWAVDEATWERAKAAADKGEYEGDSYYAVVAHIYQNMDGTIRAPSTEPVSRGATENADTNPTNTVNEEQIMTRNETIQYLTTNCDCWKGRTTTLNKLDDKELSELLTNVQKELKTRQVQEATLNTFKQGIKFAGTETVLTLNAEGQPVVRNAEGEECAPDDMECLEMMQAKKKEAPVPPPVPAGNQKKVATLKEWEDNMPPEARTVWNAAKEVEQQERKRLVTVLVGNIADDGQRKSMAQKLLKYSLPDLRERVVLVKAALAANAQNGHNRDTLTGNGADDWVPPYQPPGSGNPTIYVPGGSGEYHLTDNESEDILPDPTDTYANSGFNDPTLNAGPGIVRHFRPQVRTRGTGEARGNNRQRQEEYEEEAV